MKYFLLTLAAIAVLLIGGAVVLWKSGPGPFIFYKSENTDYPFSDPVKQPYLDHTLIEDDILGFHINSLSVTAAYHLGSGQKTTLKKDRFTWSMSR